MGYVEKVLQPGEKVIARAKLHWIIYAFPALMLILAIALVIVAGGFGGAEPFFYGAAALAAAVAVIAAARAWFDQWITEIAVTNVRIIHKRGFIWRTTREMNMEKVESVTVDQSLLGRLLGYGTIHVLGTGEGIAHLHQIADPIALRNAIIISR